MKSKQTRRLDVLLDRLADGLHHPAQAQQARLFEQYVLRDFGHYWERQQLWNEYQAGASITGPEGLRRRLGAIDPEYFGRAYLPHYFSDEPPPFHGELDDIWRQGVMKNKDPLTDAEAICRAAGCRRAIEAPRGHAKSTNFTLKGPLHAALYQYKRYILILSDSSDQAEGFLADIRTEIEDNALIRADFGELKGKKAWKTAVLLLDNDVKIEAIGSGKKIRGRRHRQWRPDLIICDDLENDEHVNTPEQRRKLETWFNKAVSNAGDTYTDIVYIGTLLHYDSLLAKVSRKGEYRSRKYRAINRFSVNTNLWDVWAELYNDLEDEDRHQTAWDFFAAHHDEMLEGTEVLWPGRWDYYSLMVKKLSIGDAAFGSEYQNDPIDPATCVFQPEWFHFYDDPDQEVPDFSAPHFVLVGCIDPSLGKNRKSDTSAILAGALDTRTGYLYILLADIARRKPDAIMDDALESSRHLKREYGKGYYKFGVEVNQFQLFFKDVLAKYSAEAGEYLPIEEILSTQNKDFRIRSTTPAVKNGYIRFSCRQKTLLQQMKEYPMGAHDDGPDCLEMLYRLAMSVQGSAGSFEYTTVKSRSLHFPEGAY